jgi:spermidine synthase
VFVCIPCASSRVIEIYLSPTQGHILFLNQSMQLTQLEAPHYHEMIVHTALSYLPQVR